MVYTAKPKRISREMSDEIDEWQASLAKQGVKLSKEDVSIIMAEKLRHDGGSGVINLFAAESRRPKVTHKLQPDLMDMDLNEFMNMQVSDLVKRLNLVKA